MRAVREWNEAERWRLKLYVQQKLASNPNCRKYYIKRARIIIARIKYGMKYAHIARKRKCSTQGAREAYVRYEHTSAQLMRLVYKNKLFIPQHKTRLLQEMELKPTADVTNGKCPTCMKSLKWITWSTHEFKEELADNDRKIITTKQIREVRCSCLCLKPGWLEEQAKIKKEKLEKKVKIDFLLKKYKDIGNQANNLTLEFQNYRTNLGMKYKQQLHSWEQLTPDEAAIYREFYSSAEKIQAMLADVKKQLNQLGEYGF